MNQGFTATKVALILGVKKRTIIDWSNRHFVTPEISDSSGRGSRRVYSKFNLVQFGLVRELFKHRRMSREEMSLILGSIEKAVGKGKSNKWVNRDLRHKPEWLFVIDNSWLFVGEDLLPLIKAIQAGNTLTKTKIIGVNITKIKEEIANHL